MGLKAVYGLTLTLLLVSMLFTVFDVPVVVASGTIYIRADGSIDPLTAPISTVDNVTYTFTDNIYDSIVIERDNIVVDGAGYTIQGVGSVIGIDLSYRSNVTVKNTNIKNFSYGIEFSDSHNNTIYGNNITNNWDGMRLHTNSSYNTIHGNNITNNYSDGIYIEYSSYNTIYGNNITANYNCGVFLWACSNNFIYHNNFVNNFVQASNPESANIWDDGYPSGGNYWNDYIGNDTYSGPYQNETGSDGIGDTPYIIDANNQDRYPLMNPWVPPLTYALTITVTSGGTTNPAPGTYTYTAGTAINVTAIPDVNCIFDHWELDGSWNYSNPISVTMDMNHTLHAIFVLGAEYFIKLSSDVPGSYRGTTLYLQSNYTDPLADDVNIVLLNTSQLNGHATRWIEDATVLYDEENSVYKMWVVACTGEPYSYWSVYYMESDSLLDWSAKNIQECYYGVSDYWSHTRQSSISVLKESNSSYKMWFQNYQADGWKTQIWYRSSADGITWTEPQLVIGAVTLDDWGMPVALHLANGTDDRLYYHYNYQDVYDFYYLYRANVKIDGTTTSNITQIAEIPHGYWGLVGATIIGNQNGDNHHRVWFTQRVGPPPGTGPCELLKLDSFDEGQIWNITNMGIYNTTNYTTVMTFYAFEIPPVHDVAITNIAPSKSVVGQGYSLDINVTAANQGDHTETFNVTVYANTTIIETKTNITLTNGNSTTITFTWNTSGFAKGNYTIKAVAEQVPGETDFDDNTCIDGWILITKVGDFGGGLPPEFFKCDGKVDGIDLALFIACYKELAPPEAIELADLGGGLPPQFYKCDGKVDGLDLALFIACYKGLGPPDP